MENLTADERLILTIGRYYYLTAEQLRRRYYGNALSYVQARLKRLTEAGYLHAIKRSPYGRGSLPIVYTLGDRGRKLSLDYGLDLPARFRPADEDRKYSLFMGHTLAINDVLIAGELSNTLTRFVHERTIKRLRLPYYPDAYFETETDGYLLELDMGTEKQEAWRVKIKKLTELIGSTHYRQAFESELFLAVIVVTPNEARRQTLAGWTVTALHELGKSTWMRAFRFTTIDVATDTDRLPTIL